MMLDEAMNIFRQTGRIKNTRSFDRQQFCEQHSGKTFADIGIKVIPLENFDYNKDRMI